MKTCPCCGDKVARLVEYSGRMMCAACAAEATRNKKLLATIPVKGR